MGIFNFLKTILKEKEVKEPEKEQVSFSDIGKWVEIKTKENEAKEQEILILVKDKINVFTNELQEKIIILESVDIDSKKAEDKIKSVVEDSRRKYIEFLGVLINLVLLQFVFKQKGIMKQNVTKDSRTSND